MKSRQSFLGVSCAILLAVLSLAFSSRAFAQAQESPREVVVGAIEKIQSTLNDRGLSSDERVALLDKKITELVDFETLSRLILARYTGQDKVEKFDDFVSLYGVFFGAILVRQLEEIREARFEVLEETLNGQRAEVRVNIYRKNNDIDRVKLLLILKSNGWKLYEIDFGLTTLSRFQYADFQRKLRDGNMEGLFSLLMEKIRESQDRNKK